MGAGTCGVFGHSTWVNGANFAHDLALKRKCVAAMPLALDFGSLMWTLLYPVLNLGSQGTLLLQAILIAATLVFRVVWMYRLPSCSAATASGHGQNHRVCSRLKISCVAYWSDSTTGAFFFAIALTLGLSGSLLSDVGNVVVSLLVHNHPDVEQSLNGATSSFLFSNIVGRVVVLI